MFPNLLKTWNYKNLTSNFPLFLLLLLTAVTPFNNGFFSDDYTLLFYIATFIGFSFTLLKNKTFLTLKSLPGILASLALALYLVSAVISPNPAKSAYSFFYLAALYLVFLTALNIEGKHHSLFRLILLIVPVIMAVIGFYEYIGSSLTGKRMHGTFVNPNIFGSYIAFSLLFYIQLLTDREIPVQFRYVILLPVIILSAALYLSGSKGAFISLICGIAALFLFINRRKTLILTGVIFISFAVFQGLIYIYKIEDFRLNFFDPARIAIWKTSIKMILDRPLSGFGAGMFEDCVGRYDFQVLSDSNLFKYNIKPNFAHSEYLQIWIEGGGFLFAASVSLLLLYLSYPIKNYPLIRDKKQLPVFFAASVAILTHSIIDFPLHFFGLSIPFVISSAFAVRLLLDEGRTTFGTCKKISSKIICFIFSFLALIAVSLTVSDYYYIKGAASYPLGKGVSYLNKSLMFNPFKSETFAKRGEYIFRIAREKKTPPDMTAVEREFIKASEYNPHRWAYPYTLGQYYWLNYLNNKSSGSMDKAVFYIKTAIGMEPYNPQLYFNLGTMLYDAGKPDDADALFKKAAEIEQMYSKAYYYRGLISKQKKDYDTAIKFMKEAAVKYKTFRIYYPNPEDSKYETAVASLNLKEVYKELTLIYLLKNDSKTARFYIDLFSKEGNL